MILDQLYDNLKRFEVDYDEYGEHDNLKIYETCQGFPLKHAACGKLNLWLFRQV